MEKWSLYCIRCRDNSLYTGISNNVLKRFETHCHGKGAKYLKGRGPLDLVLNKKIGPKSLALRLEKKIKKLPKLKKETLIKNQKKIKGLIKELSK